MIYSSLKSLLSQASACAGSLVVSRSPRGSQNRPKSSEFIVSIIQRYFATSPSLNFCRRIAETTPDREAMSTLLSWTYRPSKLPPFFKSESWTVENSLGKRATNGLLDKNLLILTPHILTFKTNHCLFSSVEGECSNSTLPSSKGSITVLDRGKLTFLAFAYTY